MNFDFTDEQKRLKQTIRAFAESEIAPGAAQRDQKCRFPWELIPKLAQKKLLGVVAPKEYGGAGLDTMSMALIIEEIARVDGATALIVVSHNALCVSHIDRFGNEEQRKRYIPRLTAGEALGAWALTEPDAGSDVSVIGTTAQREGDQWVLNGQKMFVTQGTVAGVYIIFAATDPTRGTKGVSAFVVEKGTPGLMAGEPLDKFGMRASDTAPLSLEEVQIPAENLIGELHAGYVQMMEILNGGRICIGAMAVGLAQGAFETALVYAKQRVQFGKPIAEHQAIGFMLADMGCEIEAARHLVYHAAYLADQGRPYRREASMAKLYASEMAMRVTNKALQIHGGYGFLKSSSVERYLRDAKLCEIGEGTSEVQRMIIARELLRDSA